MYALRIFTALSTGTDFDKRHQSSTSAEDAIALSATIDCYSNAIHGFVFDLCH